MSDESLRLEIHKLRQRWHELKAWIGTNAQDKWDNKGESAEATGMWEVLKKMDELEMDSTKWLVVWIQEDYDGNRIKCSDTFVRYEDTVSFITGMKEAARFVHRYLRIECVKKVIA